MWRYDLTTVYLSLSCVGNLTNMYSVFSTSAQERNIFLSANGARETMARENLYWPSPRQACRGPTGEQMEIYAKLMPRAMPGVMFMKAPHAMPGCTDIAPLMARFHSRTDVVHPSICNESTELICPNEHSRPE